MRTNKELKTILRELEQIKANLADALRNPFLTVADKEDILISVAPNLRQIKDRFDRIDRVWAKDSLVNDIDAVMKDIFGRENIEDPALSVVGLYQSVKEDVAGGIASRGIRSEMDIFKENVDAMDENAQDIDSRNGNLISYMNNPNNNRNQARVYRVLTKVGLGAAILGLGGTTFGVVHQNARYNELQTKYSIMAEDFQENIDAKNELEQQLALSQKETEDWSKKAGEWYTKYNELLQNGGGSGISQEKYNQLKEECDQWKTKYNNLNSSYNSVLAKYDAIMEVIPEGSNAVSYITGLVENVKKLNSEVANLENQIVVLEAAKTTLENKVKELAAQLDAALKDNADQQLINTLKQQLEETAARYGELQIIYDKAVQDHNAKVAEYESRIKVLEGELQTEKDKNNTLQNENNELKAVAQKIGEVYAKLYPNGKVTGAGNQFNAILTYYSQQPNGINLARDFLVKFVAEVKGVPQSQIAKLSDADLVAMADALVGLPSAPAQNPNGNVHENGSGNTGSTGSTGSTEEEKDEQNNGDGTGNISPDLPPVRE